MYIIIISKYALYNTKLERNRQNDLLEFAWIHLYINCKANKLLLCYILQIVVRESKSFISYFFIWPITFPHPKLVYFTLFMSTSSIIALKVTLLGDSSSINKHKIFPIYLYVDLHVQLFKSLPTLWLFRSILGWSVPHYT